MPLQNTSLWHEDYFELKQLKTNRNESQQDSTGQVGFLALNGSLNITRHSSGSLSNCHGSFGGPQHFRAWTAFPGPNHLLPGGPQDSINMGWVIQLSPKSNEQMQKVFIEVVYQHSVRVNTRAQLPLQKPTLLS